MTAARRVLRLVKSTPVQPVRLRTLPCRVCGANPIGIAIASYYGGRVQCFVPAGGI